MEKSEDRILSEFHVWLWNYYPEFRRLCFHPNNEGAKNKRQAAMDKAKGVVAGIADYIILIPNNEYHGLMIEFKLPGEKQRTEQLDHQNQVEKHGYRYQVCYSVEEAQALFLKHTQLSRRP